VRHITADGKGMVVFFFHGGKFVGWDSKYEIAAVNSVKAAGARSSTSRTRATARAIRCAARRSRRRPFAIAGRARG
jgi:hypothetical protein